MWLVNTKKETSLELFLENELPPYAILSHTWGHDEVSFQDMQSMFRKPKQGWSKIKSACERAEKDGYHYLWADTCCIDKTSSAELQEAINSMFRWYERAAVCYVYLSDVQCPAMTDDWAQLQVPGEGRRIRIVGAKLQRWKQVFAESRWFTRGWTLQELIAPRDCVFFNVDWSMIGTKKNLIKTISQITRIEPSILSHHTSLFSVSIAKRMSWAARRQTSRMEDRAYSLLGIFDVNIPMLYGEGTKAFIRLQEEIIKNSTDQSIFAWESTDAYHNGNLLAESPANFANAGRIIQLGQSESFNMTNRGLRIGLRGQTLDSIRLNRNHTWAALNCRFENDISGVIALRLIKYSESDEYHAVRSEDIQGSRDLVSQPWDSDSVVRLGRSSRLVFIRTEYLDHAVMSSMNITRKYEPRHSPVVFAIETGEDAGNTSAVYPEHLWSAEDGFVNTMKQPRMRAGMLIARSPEERWIVTFGFDQDEEAEHDRLVPHLSVQVIAGPDHTPGEMMRSLCELSRSSALLDRTDRTKLLAKAPSASQPGDLLVSLRRSEIMGTLVYTIRIEFSGFPELDSVDTQRLLEEPKVVEASSAIQELDAVETQRYIHVSSFWQIISNALRKRRAIHLLGARKQLKAQHRLPLSGATIKLKLWIRFEGSDFKLREIYPEDVLHVDDGIVAYSSSAVEPVTFGMLIESSDGILYHVFVYHGHRQHSHMFSERPTARAISEHTDNQVSQPPEAAVSPVESETLEDNTGSRNSVPEEDPKSGETPEIANSSLPGQDPNSNENARTVTSQGQSEITPRPISREDEAMRRGSLQSDGGAGISEVGSEDTFTSNPEFHAPNVQPLGPDEFLSRESGIGGVLAGLHTDQTSLKEMTEAIDNCNRGVGLCENVYHDRTSHPYTFAKVVVDETDSLRVDMSRFPSPSVTAIVIEIKRSTSTGEMKDSVSHRAGLKKDALDLSQSPNGEIMGLDRKEDPDTNYADKGIDYSTLAGLRTGVDIGAPRTMGENQ